MKPNEMLNDYSELIETALASFLPSEEGLQGEVVKAMKYSLLGGGKRIRPALLLEIYKLCGGNVEEALPFACGVEMIHTYSLIHDDLPCMDDDSFRRNKPTCHKAFSEEIALLAGDALLTLAFKTAALTDSTKISSDKIVLAIAALADAAGADGMVGGQVMDLDAEGKEIPLEVLRQIHSLKTGKMFNVCADIAYILAGAEKEKHQLALEYTKKIGLAFQIRDDILDVIGKKEILGKDINSDASNDKSTYVSLLGIEKSKAIVNELSESAKKVIGEFGDNSDRLKNLAEYLALRDG